MSWLEETENHRRCQVAMMAKAFGGNDIQKATDNDVSEKEEKKPKKKVKPNNDKSDMYKMKMLKLRKFNEQDQKEYIGVEDVANSYIANHENGDIIISKTTDGYLVSKFPIDAENEEGEEKEAATLSEAIDVALQYKDDLDNAKSPEQIMYKETEDSDDDEYEEDDDNSEKGFDDEINPFERAAWEAEQDEIRKAYETLGLDYDDIEKAKHQDGDMHPNGKWVWRQSANGGKGDWRVAKPGGNKSASATSTASTTQKQDSGNKPKLNIVGISDMQNALAEYARGIKHDWHTTVKVRGKVWGVAVSQDGNISVYDDNINYVKNSAQGYKEALLGAYNEIQEKKKEDTAPAAKTTSVTKEQLDGAEDGSSIKVTNKQTGNIELSFTKKNGKWFSKNSKTRSEIEVSAGYVSTLAKNYNRRTYNTEVNLSGVKKTAAASSTTSTTQKQDDKQSAKKKTSDTKPKKAGLGTKKTSEKSFYEDDTAEKYDKGDGKIGNYPVPTHTSYPALNLYNRLHNNRHFGFKYGMPRDEIMEKLKNYKGNVAVSYHNNAGTLQIYRIKFL